MKPLVSFLTPTMNRAELHPQLHRGFAADLWPNKELVVLDESVKASPYFSKLRDPRVRYVHAPMVGARVVNRIGTARNRLVALSRGSFIEHRDDDDTYDPIWTQFGMERLGSADLLKLDVYRIITDPEPGQPAMIFEWDTRKFGGEHYALQGNEAIKSQVSPDELPPDVVSMFRDGYGYSIMGPRRTFERFPFPAEGTEDFAFLRAVRDSGGKTSSSVTQRISCSTSSPSAPKAPCSRRGSSGASCARWWGPRRTSGRPRCTSSSVVVCLEP